MTKPTRDHQDLLFQLPQQLQRADVTLALAEHASLGEWPEGCTIAPADLPGAFARLLRGVYHPELEAARIASLFKRTLAGQGCRVAARVERASPELAYLGQVDFVVLYNWTAWGELTLLQRLALVDHELSHCGRDPDAGWITIPHDLEEFGTIVRRWGSWHPGIRDFRHQPDLFAKAGGEAPPGPEGLG